MNLVDQEEEYKRMKRQTKSDDEKTNDMIKTNIENNYKKNLTTQRPYKLTIMKMTEKNERKSERNFLFKLFGMKTKKLPIVLLNKKIYLNISRIYTGHYRKYPYNRIDYIFKNITQRDYTRTTIRQIPNVKLHRHDIWYKWPWATVHKTNKKTGIRIIHTRTRHVTRTKSTLWKIYPIHSKSIRGRPKKLLTLFFNSTHTSTKKEGTNNFNKSNITIQEL